MSQEDTKSTLLRLIHCAGELSLNEAIEQTELARTTLKEHFLQLENEGLVERRYERKGRGRPRLVFSLTDKGRFRFPSNDGRILNELLEYLQKNNMEKEVRSFFQNFWTEKLKEARKRMDRYPPEDRNRRLEALKAYLEEQGFMPSISFTGDSQLLIKECNCPFSNTVANTNYPCELEKDFFSKLLGTAPKRLSYIPHGEASCSYRFDLKEVENL